MELKEPEKEIEYEPYFNESGELKLKKKANVKRGSLSKSSGNQFESRVRKDLEEKKWIVDKWTNNIDPDLTKIIPAKRKFNPSNKIMTIGTGFPDFIAFQKRKEDYKIIGVEVKMNNILSKTEKEKCLFYLRNKIFSEIWIASKKKDKNKVKIIYENFLEKYPKYML